MTNDEAHRLAREKGVSRPLYALVRAVVKPALRTYVDAVFKTLTGLSFEDAEKKIKEPGGLTDPTSVELGIGPICREKYGFNELADNAKAKALALPVAA